MTEPVLPLVVLIPVYEEPETTTRLFVELAAVDPRTYVVAVDDGSVQSPVDLESIAAAGLRGEVLRLRRNVGHQRAIAIGLCHIAETMPTAGCVVVMDADGEDMPQSVGILVDCIENSNAHVVVAQRRRRVETTQFRSLYWCYKRVFETLVGRRIDFGNFMALRPYALQRLTGMSELWIHVPACVLSSKLRIVGKIIDRGPRYAGASNQ